MLVRPGATPHPLPTRRAPLKLQGQYMALLRGLSAKQEIHVKTVRATKGIRAAITTASELR